VSSQELKLSKNISAQRGGHVGYIMLSRPEALNALSLDMVRQIASLLNKWEKDDDIKAVFITGEGDRAFCSGGDLKSFYFAGMDYRRGAVSMPIPALFFGEEYQLNRQIFYYPKPIVSFMNGITMGGGYGIAGHCKYQVACPKTVFAMPETGIGFFPDVGAMYHLTRCAGELGKYIALTGDHLSGADMAYAGLASHYVVDQNAQEIVDLMTSAIEKNGDIGQALDKISVSPVPCELQKNHDDIDVMFKPDNVHDIMDELGKANNSWAQDIYNALARCSPISLEVTARHYARSRDQDFDRVIEKDFTLCQNFMQYPDIYEGIRATLIDKDRVPVWEPSSLADIEEGLPEKYFTADWETLGEIKIFNS